QRLVNQGLIQSNAFSLWLNDLDASTGSILFGGVNTEKFKGQLQKLPIQKVNNDFSEFIVALTRISLSSGTSKINLATNSAIPALLDSGSSLTYLPDSIASSLFNAVGAEWDEQQATAF